MKCCYQTQRRLWKLSRHNMLPCSFALLRIVYGSRLSPVAVFTHKFTLTTVGLWDMRQSKR